MSHCIIYSRPRSSNEKFISPARYGKFTFRSFFFGVPRVRNNWILRVVNNEADAFKAKVREIRLVCCVLRRSVFWHEGITRGPGNEKSLFNDPPHGFGTHYTFTSTHSLSHSRASTIRKGWLYSAQSHSGEKKEPLNGSGAKKSLAHKYRRKRELPKRVNRDTYAQLYTRAPAFKRPAEGKCSVTPRRTFDIFADDRFVAAAHIVPGSSSLRLKRSGGGGGGARAAKTREEAEMRGSEGRELPYNNPSGVRRPIFSTARARNFSCVI